MKKFVYSFNEGAKEMRSLLGGKGANLAEMTKIGLPVPFGFTVSTEACNRYYSEGKVIGEDIVESIFEKIEELENVTGKGLGSAENPLLVSVRSGSVFSMPGMMDTILNLGMNDETVEGLAKLTGNPRFAYDSYRRFIQMFSDVVLGIPKSDFEKILAQKKEQIGAKNDLELSADDFKEIITEYKAFVDCQKKGAFPQEPREQLLNAIKAVFNSWNNERAVLYRSLNDIPDNLGTAVNVQSMVFGNMGETSGTGVAFTRNPANGENAIFGEFLVNAQGEDIVAGVRTPEPIEKMEEKFPEAYKAFSRIAALLEKHYKDMQDMEFTVEDGKLFILQTRSGKRTAPAAVKIAVDMVKENLIDKKTAVTRIESPQIDQLLHPEFDAEAEKKALVIARGLPASPGAAYGKVCFSTDEVQCEADKREKIILVRNETSPEDLAGMVLADGILTATGGMTSHAAVVARGMGKCCVSGCTQIDVDETLKTLTANGKTYREGDYISINGTTGTVYEGRIKTVPPSVSGDFAVIMEWADEIRDMGVRANADNPEDAKKALAFGAEGIGLCRTEHMFFSEERIPAIRRMILADTAEERTAALNIIRPFQQSDFKEMFLTMGELPVTIRLLDPPLHEFLPKTKEEIEELARQIGVPYEKLMEKAQVLHEFNPMLGKRGCRLAVLYPEIAAMQTEAIIMAAIEVKRQTGLDIKPEIMIPLVAMKSELLNVKKTITQTAEKCFERENLRLDYLVGTMIETPRAALIADQIATEAEFFSFGTNDLTQMTYGLSRDDTGELIGEYMHKGVLEKDPFKSIDEAGVGKLIEMAATMAKQVRPKVKLGICGEHGGDSGTIDFCERIGLNYVSCSPFRIPSARLSAAQAAVRKAKTE